MYIIFPLGLSSLQMVSQVIKFQMQHPNCLRKLQLNGRIVMIQLVYFLLLLLLWFLFLRNKCNQKTKTKTKHVYILIYYYKKGVYRSADRGRAKSKIHSEYFVNSIIIIIFLFVCLFTLFSMVHICICMVTHTPRPLLYVWGEMGCKNYSAWICVSELVVI